MSFQIKTLAIVSALALTGSAFAQVSLNNNSLGSATSFPTYSISGANGTLFFQSVLTTPSGATLQGGSSQGFTASTGFGEVFNYTGPGALLGAISIVDNGGGGVSTYQPFLFDLGTTIYNAPSSVFNPSAHANLLAAQTVTPSPFGAANFLEFDFSGSDAITLVTGESYAFGLLNNNAQNDLFFRRSGGGASDPNGDGFTLSSLSATSDNASPWSSAVRTMMIGVYTEPVPEPATMTLLGFGSLVSIMFLRRKVS